MADFRIDEMKLTKAGDIYNLKLRVNATTAPVEEITGTMIGNSIFFDPGDIGEDEGITFLYPNLNLSNLNAGEVISIYIIDSSAMEQKKKGGIAIRDTDYPPPKGNQVLPEHLEFSLRFTITELFAKRVDTSDKFTLRVDFTHNDPNHSYAADSFDFRTDLEPRRFLQDVLIFQTQESAPNGSSNSFSITAGSQGLKNMKLKNYGTGLPFFIFKSNGGDWTKVDIKKGMIFVA